MKDITSMRIDSRIVYEKVSLRTAMAQRLFFNYLDETCLELLALFGSRAKAAPDDEYKAAVILSDYINIKGIFIPAIVNNILYLAGMGDGYKTEFLRTAQNVSAGGGSGIIKRSAW